MMNEHAVTIRTTEDNIRCDPSCPGYIPWSHGHVFCRLFDVLLCREEGELPCRSTTCKVLTTMSEKRVKEGIAETLIKVMEARK